MFAPARLCTTGTPARAITDATMAAVVVLPLVAETTTEPRASRAESSRIAPRLQRDQHLAGQARATAPARSPRQRPHGPRRRDLRAEQRHAGTIIRTAAGSTRTVTGSSAIASPSAYSVNGSVALMCTSRPRST